MSLGCFALNLLQCFFGCILGARGKEEGMVVGAWEIGCPRDTGARVPNLPDCWVRRRNANPKILPTTRPRPACPHVLPSDDPCFRLAARSRGPSPTSSSRATITLPFAHTESEARYRTTKPPSIPSRNLRCCPTMLLLVATSACFMAGSGIAVCCRGNTGKKDTILPHSKLLLHCARTWSLDCVAIYWVMVVNL